MFRKIRSNRDPGLTLWSELSREFSVHLLRLSNCCRKLFGQKPGLVFAMMVSLILLSFCYEFVLRQPDSKPKPAHVAAAAPLAVPEKEFAELMLKASGLKESLAIKAGIEALIEKDSLTAADSVQLEKAIKRLHELSIH